MLAPRLQSGKQCRIQNCTVPSDPPVRHTGSTIMTGAVAGTITPTKCRQTIPDESCEVLAREQRRSVKRPRNLTPCAQSAFYIRTSGPKRLSIEGIYDATDGLGLGYAKRLREAVRRGSVQRGCQHPPDRLWRVVFHHATPRRFTQARSQGAVVDQPTQRC